MCEVNKKKYASFLYSNQTLIAFHSDLLNCIRLKANKDTDEELTMKINHID